MGEPAIPTSLDLAMTEPKVPLGLAVPVPDVGGEGGGDDPSRLRLRAEALLASLARARDETRHQLATFNRADAMEAVVGRSAIDTAIERTRQSLRCFDEALLSRNKAHPRQPGSAT